ncbi:MAG: hypothetical protein R3A79_12035, partial [Nannocystaceae bacterium]
NRVIARVAPIPHDHSDPITSLTVLFDTSASQSLGFDAQIERLGELLAALREWSAEDIPLRVICFDQGTETVFEGRISDFSERHVEAIRRRGALGASDLIGALRYAGSQPSRAYGRVVVFTDGVITAGAGHVEAIRGEVSRLAEVGVQRVDVLGLGDGGRDPLLAAIARADLDRDGVILRGDVAPELALRKLLHRVVSGVEVKVPGSKWVYPERIDGIQADDTVLVYAELADDGPFDILFDGSIRARPTVTTVDSGAPPLLDNAWYAARVRWMEDQLRGCDEEFCGKWRRRITDESIEHRLVNDATALVMLGDSDERRFGLDPSAPAGLLAFGRDGATLKSRAPRDELRGRRSSTHALLPEPVLPDMHRAEVASAEVAEKSGRPTAPPGAERAPILAPDIAPKPRISAASLIDSVVEETPRDKPQVGPLRRPKDAYDGALLTVMDSLRIGDSRSAQRRAEVWRSEEPASVLALIALGEALEANGDAEAAARAYGSIIDLFPMRPEMRRLAAARLERIGQVTRWLVLDSYGRALRKQSDDPSSHRLLGYALLRSGYYREAFEVMVSGFAWARASAASQTMARVLYDDIGLVAAAWIAARPEDEEFVRAALKVQEIEPQTEPSLRFVLTWDTPISDVDLHVRDGDGRHAFYKNRELVSGGRLYGDVATGRGIEAFVIDGAPEAYPYNLQIGYYTLDPVLGYGMGKVEVIEHDGQGTLTFDQRPFVVSRDGGTVDLGLIAAAPSSTE